MKKKEKKLVVAFHTTADAMAMEKACKKQKCDGRLIPVPRAISAGCGIAWCSQPEEKELIQQILESEKIDAEQMVELEL